MSFYNGKSESNMTNLTNLYTFITECVTCSGTIYERREQPIEKDKKNFIIMPLSNWATSKDMCDIWDKMSNTDEYCKWVDNPIGNQKNPKNPKNQKSLTLSYNHSDPDYYLIVNFLPGIKSVKDLPVPIDKIIVAHMEPNIHQMDIPEIWRNPHNHFKLVIDHKSYYNLLEWHISTPFKTLMTSSIEKNKGNCISIIMSNKKMDPGHVKRIDLVNNLINDQDFKRVLYTSDNKLYTGNKVSNTDKPFYEFNLDVYGDIKLEKLNDNVTLKGTLPYQQKDQGLFGYKYHINCENNMIKGYNTEKIIDGILSECLVFYWGSDSLDNLIDSKAYIKLPFDSDNNYAADIKIIKDAIRSDEHSKRLPFIKKAKVKILNELQLFPHLLKILN